MANENAATINLSAQTLREEHTATGREWLVTNGLGGYASASVSGANTRRYHGLLVAALHPPLGRAVLLSKLEETLEVNGKGGKLPATYPLSTNLYPGVTHPQGYRSLDMFAATPAPTWTWSPASGVRFEKRVWMAQGQNTTYISYRLLEAPTPVARLRLVPLLAWKDYHSEMQASGGAVAADWSPCSQPGSGAASRPSALRITLPGVWNVTMGPLSLTLQLVTETGMPCPEAAFEAGANWYYRFLHPRERERGLDYEEDLYAPGTLTAPLRVGESLVVIASVEDAPTLAPHLAWESLKARQCELLKKAGAEETFTQQLTLAADQFVVQAPGVRSTVIAGYPWFCDWGRDTMIALPGLCLTTGRPEIAREILLSFADHIDQGMLPNRFPDRGETPEYNTVDATLWYFNALYLYVEATEDIALIADSLWGALTDIIRWHRQGTRYNIHVDSEDGLLFAGEAGVQLTWMDAKVGDWVVTPRIGKPVEINALWYNALRIMAAFAGRLGKTEEAAEYTELADQCGASFRQRFPRPDGHGLYDTLDTPPDGQPDASVRPNQIFALSLPFAPIAPTEPVAQSILAIVRNELWTEGGLRTLSPHDPAYCPCYEGDPGHRDSAYHQGTAWPWLLGALVESVARAASPANAKNPVEACALLRPLLNQLTTFCIGSLPEVFDGDAPQRPNGCIAQAWSVAETLRVWKRLTDRHP